MRRWKKNGKYFNGSLEIDGRTIMIDMNSEPDPELMQRAGYTEEVPPAPTPAPEPQPDPFDQVKASFWTYIDEAAAALSEATGDTYTRADFPTGAFSADLLAWCAEHGMAEAASGALAIKLLGIVGDLARLGRNWEDLFLPDPE